MDDFEARKLIWRQQQEQGQREQHERQQRSQLISTAFLAARALRDFILPWAENVNNAYQCVGRGGHIAPENYPADWDQHLSLPDLEVVAKLICNFGDALRRITVTIPKCNPESSEVQGYAHNLLELSLEPDPGERTKSLRSRLSEVFDWRLPVSGRGNNGWADIRDVLCSELQAAISSVLYPNRSATENSTSFTNGPVATVSDRAPAIAAVEEPKEYLTDWMDICKCLRQDPVKSKKTIQDLNKKFDGPIVTKQGAAPFVDKAKLLGWWNDLESRHLGHDEHVTLPELETYHHGKAETVVPEISGHVTQRVKGRNTK